MVFVKRLMATEKIFKSTLWKSPYTGVVELTGTGKGMDGPILPLGGSYEIEKEKSCEDPFHGGIFAIPTKEMVEVKRGEYYSIWLASMDGQIPPNASKKNSSSLNCIFDKKLVLGYFNASNKNHFRYHYRSVAKFSQPFQIGNVITVSQEDKFPNYPSNAKKGSGIGGSGFSGEILMESQNRFQVLKVKEEGGLGGTGYLEISYPYPWKVYTIIENNFLAKKEKFVENIL